MENTNKISQYLLLSQRKANTWKKQLLDYRETIKIQRNRSVQTSIHFTNNINDLPVS